jgi:hypothetical protein
LRSENDKYFGKSEMAKMTTILERRSILEVVCEASFFRPELNEAGLCSLFTAHDLKPNPQ